MDATMEATVVDPRKMGPELVFEATQAALDDARKKAPEATLEQLFAEIGPHVLYDYWLPFKFKKKGCYRQVAGLFKRVREQMLGVELVEQTEPVSRHPLPPKIAAELTRGVEQLKLFLTGLETVIVAGLESQSSELLRYSEAKTVAEVVKHERLVKTAEKESADHLAAAAAFESERDQAINGLEELTAQLAVEAEKCHSSENVVSSLTDQLSCLTDQLRVHSERADAAFAKVDDADRLIANLRDQVSTLSDRVFQAETERNALRNEAALYAGLLAEKKEQLAATRGQVKLLTQELHLYSVRADRGHTKGGRQHYHPYPTKAVWISRRKGRSELG